MKAVIDNDVLIKGSCYGLLPDLVGVIPSALKDVAALGAARYVATDAIRKLKLNGDTKKILKRMNAALDEIEKIEPTRDEDRFAADLEYLAQREHVSLDIGESQLCAALLMRKGPILATGDKRAAQALETLLDQDGRLKELRGKIICLEQLMLRLLKPKPQNTLRPMICAEPQVDKTMTNCFACSSPSVPAGSCEEGLRSYIKDLRKAAGRILGVD